MADQIRLAQESDAEQMLPIYAPIIRETAISFESEPFALEAVTRAVTGLCA
jgi:L-amino acid N-acyltransferase YncA